MEGYAGFEPATDGPKALCSIIKLIAQHLAIITTKYPLTKEEIMRYSLFASVKSDVGRDNPLRVNRDIYTPRACFFNVVI